MGSCSSASDTFSRTVFRLEPAYPEESKINPNNLFNCNKSLHCVSEAL